MTVFLLLFLLMVSLPSGATSSNTMVSLDSLQSHPATVICSASVLKVSLMKQNRPGGSHTEEIEHGEMEGERV